MAHVPIGQALELLLQLLLGPAAHNNNVFGGQLHVSCSHLAPIPFNSQSKPLSPCLPSPI